MASGPYYLLTIADDNWAPQLKFYHPFAEDGIMTPLTSLVSEMQALIAVGWDVLEGDAYNGINQHTGDATYNQSGVWTGEPMPVKWCWTMTIEDEQIGGHPSIKYMRGLTENMFSSGVPNPDLLANIAALGASMASLGFLGPNGAAVSGCSFGTYSRRGKIRRRVTA